MSDSRFVLRLTEQIGNEFAASQQYIAIAVHYDADALPQLAALFYRQSVEERNHAMIMIQYLLDADADVIIPGVDAPETSFTGIAMGPSSFSIVEMICCWKAWLAAYFWQRSAPASG